MSTRHTSVVAYHTIRDSGLISKRRWEIYDCVYQHGPMTSGEAFKILNDRSPIKNLTQSRARFTELRQMGLLYEVRTKHCNITGHLAIEWDVTDKLPKEIKRPKKIACTHCEGRGWVEVKEGQQ